MQIGIVGLGEKLLSAMRLGLVGRIEGRDPIDPERKPAKSRTKSPAKSRTAAQPAEWAC